MSKYLLIIAFLIFTNPTLGQKNIDQKTLIGFACYSGGTKSETVTKFTKLLEKSNYKSIEILLDSKNSAEKFLAVFVCEKLNELGEISISNENKLKIEKIRNSYELVSVCSGCMYFDKISIRQLFKENKDNHMKIYAESWFNEHYKK